MRLIETPIVGAWIVETNVYNDNRGDLEQTYSEDFFEKHSLNTKWKRHITSCSKNIGTIRGFHYSENETKLVRCTSGKVFDVLVDLRQRVPVVFHVELSHWGQEYLYVPCGVAHSWQSLRKSSEVSYMTSTEYDPSVQRGVRWNDPALGIRWPIDNPIVSERDQNWPLLGKLSERGVPSLKAQLPTTGACACPTRTNSPDCPA